MDLFGNSTDEKHSAGGKVYLRLPAGMLGDAVFGGDRDEYRYHLRRTWPGLGGMILFVMMNPSVADVQGNDPTVAKCIRYAQSWGFSGIDIGNIFVYRATSPEALLSCDDPVGPLNDNWLLKMAMDAKQIVLAYGKPPKTLQWRGPFVVEMLRRAQQGDKLHVLKLNADNSPSHPLYLRGDLEPQKWSKTA